MLKSEEIKIPMSIEMIQSLLDDGAVTIYGDKWRVYLYVKEPKGYVVVRENGVKKIVIS